MYKALSNPALFAAAALLFVMASFANTSGAAVSTSLVMNSDTVAPIEMKSGGSLPPDPFEDPPNVIAKNTIAKQ